MSHLLLHSLALQACAQEGFLSPAVPGLTLQSCQVRRHLPQIPGCLMDFLLTFSPFILPPATQGAQKLLTLLLSFLFCFEIRSCYVAQAGLELMILLHQPLECWDYRCVPPHLAKTSPSLLVEN
jgi:hypothetical protein